MANEKHGGPAFPCTITVEELVDDGYRKRTYLQEGMDLRDYFAGQVVGVIAYSAWTTGRWEPPMVAASAYELADAMLKAREK